jgi:fatty acid desaturase
MGSVNYRTGGDFNDMMHGWLNYQIEHHLFPNIPLSQYQELQPKIKKLCIDNNIPYRENSVWKRLLMSFRLMVGKEKLLIWEDYIKENNITIIYDEK